MLALYRSGRRAEGLDVYRRTRAFFVEELGLEPGVELQELERAILVRTCAEWAAARRGGAPGRSRRLPVQRARSLRARGRRAVLGSRALDRGVDCSPQDASLLALVGSSGAESRRSFGPG
jgi:DNA-binding SARP family transcriptional activator